MARSVRRRPRIGVTTSERGGWLMWYFNWFAIWRSGGRSVRVTAARPVPIEDLDGLVIGGGDDISLSLYFDKAAGPELEPEVRIDLERDHLERDLVIAAIARELPVLGICRGAQMINVARGGTLHQDIYDTYEGAPRLRTPLPRKRVHIEPGSRLHEILGATERLVNALHHQSVNRTGRDLKIVAHDTHGIVQAIEATGPTFMVGVQWHPEFLVFQLGQVRLFKRLVAAARKRRAIGAQPQSYEATDANQPADDLGRS